MKRLVSQLMNKVDGSKAVKKRLSKMPLLQKSGWGILISALLVALGLEVEPAFIEELGNLILTLM